MAKHRSEAELRKRFVAALADAEPTDPLSSLGMDEVAERAGMSASTLAHHVDDVAGLRRHAYVAVVAELQTEPSDAVLSVLESELARSGSPDQILAKYFWAATKQLAQDPAFPYWVGGSMRVDHPEAIKQCGHTGKEFGIHFARPLRLALAGSGLDVRSVSDQIFVDMTRSCLVAGAMDRYLHPEPIVRELRGVEFCVGGVVMAAALPALLER